MKRSLLILGVAAALAAAALLAIGAGPVWAVNDVNDCPSPVEVPGFTPWELVRGVEPVELADRDGDGVACRTQLVVRGRTLLTVLTDSTIGNPGIIPPGPCTGPFAPVAIIIHYRPVDLNGDGVLCAAASLGERTLIVLDNPNATQPRRAS